MALQRGMAQLPDLHVSDSSEAMLSGRKPPFRLLVRAVATDGRKVNIRHAVSEGFVVIPCYSKYPCPYCQFMCSALKKDELRETHPHTLERALVRSALTLRSIRVSDLSDNFE